MQDQLSEKQEKNGKTMKFPVTLMHAQSVTAPVGNQDILKARAILLGESMLHDASSGQIIRQIDSKPFIEHSSKSM